MTPPLARTSPLPATLLAALLAGCASTPKHEPGKGPLEIALADVDSGGYSEAARRLEPIVSEANAPEAGTLRDRLYAAWMLMRAHERAAYRAPFLQEPAPRDAFERGGTRAETTPSTIGHLVAVAYQANRGRRLYAQWEARSEKRGDAADEPPATDEVPAELERFTPDDVLSSLNLSLLAVYSRLDFLERVESIVAGLPDLTDVATCRQRLDAARIDPEVRPWVERGIFEYLKTRDEPNAYRFGVLALDAARDVDCAFDDAADEIVHWIQDESSYVFRSPAGTLFDPALPGCTVDGTPNIDFLAIPKADDTGQP